MYMEIVIYTTIIPPVHIVPHETPFYVMWRKT